MVMCLLSGLAEAARVRTEMAAKRDPRSRHIAYGGSS